MKYLTDPKFRFTGFLGTSFLLYLLLILLNPLWETVKSWKRYSLMDFFFEILIVLVYGGIIFETCIRLSVYLNDKAPWGSSILKRITLQYLIQIIILSFFFSLFFQLKYFYPVEYSSLVLRQAFILGSIFSFIMTAFSALSFFFKEWDNIRLETLKIQNYSIQSQLDALKLQIDPHFLFNNLSTLSSVIEEQPQIAIDYLSNFCSIYRYILENRIQNTVPLEMELDFINAYIYLYKIRYAEAIIFNIQFIPLSIRKKKIPTITLQILMENAIQHNMFSEKFPLIINIYYEGSSLIISNNLSRKVIKEKRTSIGLENIKKRYQLLNFPIPLIEENDKYFKVIINFS